eukprot:4685002-Prymnesium_polylepis.1
MDHLHATRAFDPAPLQPSRRLHQRQRPRGLERGSIIQLTARVVVFGEHVKSEWRQARERILSA